MEQHELHFGAENTYFRAKITIMNQKIIIFNLQNYSFFLNRKKPFEEKKMESLIILLGEIN